jgi:hypothetical protein
MTKENKLKIQRLMTKLDNIIFGKLRLNDETETNTTFTKGS